MSRPTIIRSSTGAQTALVASGSHPVSRASSRSTRIDQVFTMGTLSSTAAINAHRTGSSQLTSSRSGRASWARAEPALAIAGMPALREQAIPAARAHAVDREVRPPLPENDAAPPTDHPAPAEPTHKKSPATSKVELIIDSLQSYELIKPIPVVVESLGERHHVAEVPELSISISGSSLSDTLIVLKEHVTKTYDGLRIKKHLGQSLDKERARQLKMFETYIGKPRRSWF